MHKKYQPGEIVPKTGIYFCEYYEMDDEGVFDPTGNLTALGMVEFLQGTMGEIGLLKHKLPTKKIKRLFEAGETFPKHPVNSNGWILNGWRRKQWWEFWL